LKIVHAHGLTGKSLWGVTQATLTACPRMVGFLIIVEKDRQQESGFLQSSFDNAQSLVDTMDTIFSTVFDIYSSACFVSTATPCKEY